MTAPLSVKNRFSDSAMPQKGQMAAPATGGAAAKLHPFGGICYCLDSDAKAGVATNAVWKAQGSSSFLKKRTKKLLLHEFRVSSASTQNSKSFLLLFFKKEVLFLFPMH
jgi:hypothetical protein